jgi:Uncharacterized conserved protein
MIVLIARLTVKAGKKEELLALTRPLIAATRQEAGCIGYSLLDDRDDPGKCVFVEEWQDMEALKQHWQAPHLLEWRQKTKDLFAAATERRVYTAEETTL